MTTDSSTLAIRESPTAPAKSTIFLVDDHAMFREGLRQLIEREPDFMVSGDAANFDEALTGIARETPDLVITDISLSGTSGIDLIKKLKVDHPELPVLVVSMHEETLYAERALRAGAMVSDNSRTQNELTSLEVRRAVSNGMVGNTRSNTAGITRSNSRSTSVGNKVKHRTQHQAKHLAQLHAKHRTPCTFKG